jgi:hypothetical protein
MRAVEFCCCGCGRRVTARWSEKRGAKGRRQAVGSWGHGGSVDVASSAIWQGIGSAATSSGHRRCCGSHPRPLRTSSKHRRRLAAVAQSSRIHHGTVLQQARDSGLPFYSLHTLPGKKVAVRAACRHALTFMLAAPDFVTWLHPVRGDSNHVSG